MPSSADRDAASGRRTRRCSKRRGHLGIWDFKLLEEFLARGYSPDKVKVIDDMAYVLCATKYRDLKINNNFIERKLKVSATTRVYNTIANLVNLGG